MPSAWLLPEDIADVLPAQARHLEQLRRTFLDLARGFGYELVIPPLIEYLESLLSGTAHSLDLQTFKLIDQLSGRTMGLRADTTPQVARIDAHLLNRSGVTRLCYCGPVVHTGADGPYATREPLQFGAEIYGHAGPEADLEVISLALEGLAATGVVGCVVDLGDGRIATALLSGFTMDEALVARIVEALSNKDAAALSALAASLPATVSRSLQSLLALHGQSDVLTEARHLLPQSPRVRDALDQLARLGEQLTRSHPAVQVTYDLADVSGYAYHTGIRFAVHAPGARSSLVRGGRYDEVGAVFGRNRPAAGFSLDLKALASLTPPVPPRAAIATTWSEDVAQRAAIGTLRARGETVLTLLPGQSLDPTTDDCDRELLCVGGQWVLRSRAGAMAPIGN